jgi:hypothetical protein
MPEGSPEPDTHVNYAPTPRKVRQQLGDFLYAWRRNSTKQLGDFLYAWRRFSTKLLGGKLVRETGGRR